MLFEKSESWLEWSVKKLVMQSRLASLDSLGQAMFAVWKIKMLMLFVAKLGIFISNKSYPSLSII